jgi:hypothetical protein
MNDAEKTKRRNDLLKHSPSRLADMLLDAWDEECDMCKGLNEVLDQAGIEITGSYAEAVTELINQQKVQDRKLRDKLDSAHWTDAHIRPSPLGGYVAYDEAGLEHSRHGTADEARQALVLHAKTLENNHE